MNRMARPEMKITRFKEADVIVASGATTKAILSGFGDGDKTNSYINIAGTDYQLSSFKNGQGGLTPFLNAINSNYGTNFAVQSTDGIVAENNLLFFDSTSKTLNHVYQHDDLENGTYYWDSTLGNYGGFKKQ